MQQNDIQQWTCTYCNQLNKYYLRICSGCAWGKEKFYKPMQMELQSEFYQNHKIIGVIDFTFNKSEDRKEILEIVVAYIELGEIEHKIITSKQYLIKPFLIPILQTDEFSQKQIDAGITFNEAIQNIRKDIIHVFEGREKAFAFLDQCQTFEVDSPIKQFIELGRVYPKINGIINLNSMMKDLKIPYDGDCFILAEVIDELLNRSYRFHESMIGTLKNPIPEEINRIKGFQYLIVLDFEATAQEQKQKRAKQEIIEVGLQVLNIETQIIEFEYQTFVKPTEQPLLSQFNIEFNGITQDQVDNGISLQQMIIDLEKIAKQHQTCCIITVGDFDLNQLKQEAQRKGLALPQELRYYINLTKAFNSQVLSLTSMLEKLGLEFEGNAHRAMVDVINTVKIAKRVELNELMISYTFKI